MKKIRLIKLSTDKISITFNENITYISGPNSIGKTTLIEIIKYGLGLIRISSKLSNILGPSSVHIECEIGDKKLSFTRESHNRFLIINGEINAEIRITSTEIKEFYNELLQPCFINGKDDIVAYDILKEAFMTDLSYFKSKKDFRFFKQVMGIDFSYLDLLKNEIATFEKNIYQEKISFNILDKYINKVNQSIRKIEEKAKDISGIKEVKEILTEEYANVDKEHRKNIEILHEAKEVLKKHENYLNEISNERIGIFSSLFEDIYLNLTGEESKVTFTDLLNGKLQQIIGSKREITISAFYMTLFASKIDEFHNSCGLFVVDVHRPGMDSKSFNKYREVVEKIVNNNGIQYIETTTNQKGSNKIDLNEGWGFYE
ncbi:AAA family ATPase [Priestia megaterium]|uniref:AAA family ATPase n=1 Tax=Priestia megaterium TaxID=1404 RepID=UPI00188E4940|nr:AAA family ATPase [Priestia megaterium]